jgi:PAS domain S-box-containing protein
MSQFSISNPPDQEDARRLAELLREREEHLRLVIESATDFAIFTLGLDGRIVTWNVGAERILGYTDTEIIGKHVGVIFTPEDIAAGRVEYEMRMAAVEGRKNDDRWHVRKGGVRFWANGVMMPLSDESNETRGYLKILRDRTEQKLASELLRTSEDRLAIAVEGARLGLWHCDLPAGTMVWNDRCKEHFGFAAEARGAFGDLFDHVHPDDRAAARETMDRAIKERISFDSEFRIVPADGRRRWIQVKGRATADDLGQPLRLDGVTIDITEQKLREDALRDADRQKGDFLSLLAHELRNPLAAINNAVQLWLRTDRPADLAWIRGVIERQSAHLARLIDDLLDVSNISRGMVKLQKKHVDLIPLIKRAVESVASLVAQKRLALEVDVGEAPIEIFADAARIEQVVANLLTNACKFTPEGGKVRLTAQAGDEVVLTVADNGVGIPPEMLSRIFDVMVQVNTALDRTSGGLGIGLTVVENIVKCHGGTVSAVSEGVGKGSAFTVRLPALAHPQAPQSHGRIPPSPVDGLRVLLADDNRDSADGMAKILRFSGYHVITVHDGNEAVEIAKARRPGVILLDIGLPGLDGYQAARQIRQDAKLRDVVLVALSGYGQNLDRRRSADAGFDLHLIKPVDVQQLLTLLEDRFATMPRRQEAYPAP